MAGSGRGIDMARETRTRAPGNTIPPGPHRLTPRKSRLLAWVKHAGLRWNFDSWMRMTEGGHEPLGLGVIDSYIVTRMVWDVFRLLFKEAGYNNGFQYSHTIKIVSRDQCDTYLIDLVDARGWPTPWLQIYAPV